MKQLPFWSMTILYLALPALVLATDSSYQHSFKTTYANGSSQEGTLTVGKRKDCIRIALPPDELEKDHDFQDSSSGNEEMIFCQKPEPAMTSLNKQEKTYQTFDRAMVEAMHGQREQMMKQIGIEPGSGQEKDLFKSFGDAMGMIKQKQREGIEKAAQDSNRPPEQQGELDDYVKEHYPDSPSSNSMEISTQVTDLNKRGAQNGIPCKWYKMEMSGPVHMVNRVCAAAWSAILGGERTKHVMQAWMNFMKDMSKGTLMENHTYEDIMKINGFRLISIKEDGKGKVVSEERYQKSDSVKVAYVPPTDYVEESMGMMGRGQDRGARKIIPSSMGQTPPGQDVKKEPIANIDKTTLAPGECRKNKKTGEIECNTNEPSKTTRGNNPDNPVPPNKKVEDVKKQLGNALEDLGLGGLFGGN